MEYIKAKKNHLTLILRTSFLEQHRFCDTGPFTVPGSPRNITEHLLCVTHHSTDFTSIHLVNANDNTIM